MADTYYAHTRIKVSSVPELKYKEVGEKVTKSDFGDISDDEWNDMVANGVVSSQKLPEDLGASETLNQYKQRKLNAAIRKADAEGTVAELAHEDTAKDMTQDRVVQSKS